MRVRTITRLGVAVVLAGLVLAVPTTADAATGCREVAVTDQANGGSIRVFDPASRTWDASTQKWSWKPSAANGFSAAETAAWSNPSDAKLRRDRHGDYVMVTSASGGLAALVAFPSGKRLWAARPGGNTHSVELLPDGNVATASSTGRYVRLYAASQGANASYFAEYTLDQAHGVYWDPTRNVLWALGYSKLVRLTVGGTATKPTLTEAGSWALPDNDGHDLNPKLGSPDRLWITTAHKVFEFSKSQNRAVAETADANVKSQTTMPNGRVVRTIPKPGFDPSWATDTVTFLNPADSRVVAGSKIYKARVWSSLRA
ncbi:hypothetical protein F0L68_02985 [Solihabitans fulvus]|uniref:Uncharacterized protein n=1 Tax=Solihabitans fulvus TaxID=1892852 RepID=A0A5B2XTB7_9PSEU|nr:DUF6528 family protein [Solihabitans fulvus]KAA2266099.1 hypothetical protein F0L68_02985 [Solihabitans fulvus]